MNYNPLKLEYDNKVLELNIIENELSHQNNELDWYQGTDIDELKLKHDQEFKSISDLSHREDSLIAKKESLQKKGWIFKPIIYNPIIAFEQHKIYKQVKKIQALILNGSKKLEIYKLEILRYTSFDKDSNIKRIESLNLELNKKKSEYDSFFKRKERIDQKLKPLVTEILKMESSLENAEQILQKATDYDRELKNSDNSYEKAMIHQSCESELGNSRPHELIRENKSKIERLKRDLTKAKKRAILLGKKLSNDIKKLIIDGNNFCYEGSNFVGLDPLIALTKKLNSEIKVLVVFDSAIRGLLKSNDSQIESKFTPDIDIHIVATSQLADETILDIASDNANYYVISNDRFGDFKDKTAVKENRIIRHEIINHKILIHDLSINITY